MFDHHYYWKKSRNGFTYLDFSPFSQEYAHFYGAKKQKRRTIRVSDDVMMLCFCTDISKGSFPKSLYWNTFSKILKSCIKSYVKNRVKPILIALKRQKHASGFAWFCRNLHTDNMLMAWFLVLTLGFLLH